MTGTQRLGNGGDGVIVLTFAANVRVRNNVISANGGRGVRINFATLAFIENNLIGTDVTGTLPMGNAREGVSLSFDVAPVTGNTICANGSHGVLSEGANDIQGNFIGTNSAGALGLGNLGAGVHANGFRDRIGGELASEGNTIAFNNGNGVEIVNFGISTGTLIMSNSIFANGGLGIDLGIDGPMANDPCDADDFTNYPVLTSVSTTNDNTIIQGTLNSTPNSAFTIQFFSNDAHDLSGFGEGQTFIGSTKVVTDSACNASFTASLPPMDLSGRFFTATATVSDNSTSEFSQAIPVLCLTPLSPSSVFFASTGGEGSITVTGSAGCSWIATSNAAWITITSTPSNSGNGIVTYVIRDNFSSLPRQGTINIGGLVFTVTQEGHGAATCAYSISPRFGVANASGGTGSITITTGANCVWEAVSNASWITITSNCCGIASGYVTYIVAPNTSGSGRAGSITVAGQTFNVKQK